MLFNNLDLGLLPLGNFGQQAAVGLREGLQGSVSRPVEPIGMVFTQQAVGHRLQIFIGVDDIQNQGQVGKTRLQLLLRRFAAVT